jgi:chemotaxis protein methyltransferase CheR
MNGCTLTSDEFDALSGIVYRKAGIHLPETKRYLVYNRLINRLRKLELVSFGQYLDYVCKRDGELRVMIDLITTNETYFFREPQHFDFLREVLDTEYQGKSPFRVWSAACSTGEEPYSVAMVLADRLGFQGWEVVGSDINESVLETARQGVYLINSKMKFPEGYLKAFCLKGVRDNSGKIAVAGQLKRNVSFIDVNLCEEIPRIGLFDMIFLRNVMIYFDLETKRLALTNVLSHLKRGGYLIVSHTESILGTGIDLELIKKRSSVYRKA